MKAWGHNYRTLAEKLGYVTPKGERLASGVSNRLSDAQKIFRESFTGTKKD